MLNNFIFQSPGDIAFSIFGLNVYYYGIILAIAILAGYLIAYFLFKNFYDAEKSKYITDFSPYLIILGIIGARLYYFIVNYSYYLIHPLQIFNLRQGGLSIHGMIIAGTIALYIFSKIYKIEFFKLLDVFLCGSIFAQSIGRWGNFFNSEAFGLPTNLPWKLYIPISQRPVEYIQNSYFHPTFLYESILDFIIFVILFLSFKKFYKNPGTITALYLILYSAARITVEYCRIDSALNLFGIPIAQIMSILLITLGLCLIINRNYKREG